MGDWMYRVVGSCKKLFDLRHLSNKKNGQNRTAGACPKSSYLFGMPGVGITLGWHTLLRFSHQDVDRESGCQ